MLERIIDDARARAATVIHLEVEPDNVAARKLYESFGFSPSGLRRNYYAPGVDALTMALRLDAGAEG